MNEAVLKYMQPLNYIKGKGTAKEGFGSRPPFLARAAACNPTVDPRLVMPAQVGI